MNPRMINLANQFHNAGPRTTNYAEGHNNKLRHKLGPHPRLSLFLHLHTFQGLHHSIQVRSMQLDNGSPPNPRLQQSILNDQRIQEAKEKFFDDWSAINASFVDPAVYSAQLDKLIIDYLDKVQHSIGQSYIE
jgi:hypothetical protein